jgi:hypothetical protein
VPSPISALASSGSGSAVADSSGFSADTLTPTVPATPIYDHPCTHLQSGVSWPKIVTDGRVRYDHIRFANLCTTHEPTDPCVALADPKWKANMDDEYSALITIKLGILFLLVMLKM